MPKKRICEIDTRLHRSVVCFRSQKEQCRPWFNGLLLTSIYCFLYPSSRGTCAATSRSVSPFGMLSERLNARGKAVKTYGTVCASRKADFLVRWCAVYSQSYP